MRIFDEKEGEPGVPAIRGLVSRICTLRDCRFDDPNVPRALAVAVQPAGPRGSQFFAFTTARRHRMNAPIGPQGFNLHAAFRGRTLTVV